MYDRTIIFAPPGLIEKLKTYYPEYCNEEITLVSFDEKYFNDEKEYFYNVKNIDRIYQKICNILEDFEPRYLRRIRAIFAIQTNLGVDDSSASLNNWNPLLVYPEERKKAHSREGLLSRLVLTFPEVKWKFLPEQSSGKNLFVAIHCLRYPWLSVVDILGEKNIYSEDEKSNKSESVINALDIKNNISTLFDPSGLRNKIKNLIKIGGDRISLAASIDEEEEYSFLHGYIAYKLGYKCFTVSDMDSMERIFKDNKIDLFSTEHISLELTFEDLFLNFADKKEMQEQEAREIHLSNLIERDKRYKLLKEVKNRIFITVGHRYIKWYHDNKAYYDNLKKIIKGRKGILKTLYKPSGGIFNTIEQAGMLNEYWKRKKNECTEAFPSEEIEDKSGHSAHGRLLLIANKLIERAKRILDSAISVQDCLHGALLALEAQELLSYRTPTTSLEAIALKHQLEVKAECMFYGVGYSLDMKNRFKEIDYEIKAVSKWFHPSSRKKSALNAQLEILTELVEILRDFGQFDEEMECLKKIRKLNRQFYFLKNRWLKLFQPLRAYIETLISSFPKFMGALFFWPTFYGIIGYFLKIDFEAATGNPSFWQYIFNSYYTYFGLQPTSAPAGTISNIITVMTVLTGFLHLGIFISYLFSIIFRK